MSEFHDGGPAFAREYSEDRSRWIDATKSGVKYFHPAQTGMSLRDWFAGQVLAGVCNEDSRITAMRAYEYADAMLRVRKES